MIRILASRTGARVEYFHVGGVRPSPPCFFRGGGDPSSARNKEWTHMPPACRWGTAEKADGRGGLAL